MRYTDADVFVFDVGAVTVSGSTSFHQHRTCVSGQSYFVEDLHGKFATADVCAETSKKAMALEKCEAVSTAGSLRGRSWLSRSARQYLLAYRRRRKVVLAYRRPMGSCY